MKFKSKKSITVGIIFGGVCLLVLFMIIKVLFFDRNKWTALLGISPLFFMILTWFNTEYVIKNKMLSYKSGFIKGAIEILSIKEIIVGKTQFVGTKPALGTKGLIVKYNRWDDIYISPKKEKVFLQELLKVNSEIEIIYL